MIQSLTVLSGQRYTAAAAAAAEANTGFVSLVTKQTIHCQVLPEKLCGASSVANKEAPHLRGADARWVP